ncbi:MAG TPA: dNTP triphosphohydrolase, partial [Opitutales bacterium]|nr:dNTP triphosphohydrolase [Opitutales bacterium]
MIRATEGEAAWKTHFKNDLYSPFDFETFPSTRTHAPQDYRSPFQIDRDRVCFCAPFRRLQSKTQVFQSGEYDFYRTRLTHSMEVAHIGRSITNHLNITSPLLGPNFRIDVDLIEAICLAHDLGHPPFGHIGERKLNELMAPWGGFEGNAQTLRILTEIVYYQGKGKLSGMKPTRAFLDGILKYKSLFNELAQATHFPENHFLYNHQQDALAFAIGSDLPSDRPQSIECQIMDWADDAAYSLHDIIDGVRASFITPNKISQWQDSQGPSFSAEWPALDLHKTLAILSQAIEDDNIEWCFSKKIGAFIHAAELERSTAPAHFEGKTHRYDFKLTVAPVFQAECALYKRLALDLIFQSPPLQRYEFKGGMIL